MAKREFFSGGGGGGGGGGSSFVNKSDTLRSDDNAEGLLGLCAGPILGPVNGLQGVRVNGTPIEDASGQTNFKNFTCEIFNGDPVLHPRLVKLKLGGGAAPTALNLEIPNTSTSEPGTPGPWITHTRTVPTFTVATSTCASAAHIVALIAEPRSRRATRAATAPGRRAPPHTQLLTRCGEAKEQP